MAGKDNARRVEWEEATVSHGILPRGMGGTTREDRGNPPRTQPFSRAVRQKRDHFGVKKTRTGVRNEGTLKFFLALTSELFDHEDAREFRMPDSEKSETCEGSQHQSVISQPMDLGTIKQYLADGVYLQRAADGELDFDHAKCLADLFLVFRNCQFQNRHGGSQWRIADSFLRMISDRIEKHYSEAGRNSDNSSIRPANFVKQRGENTEASGVVAVTEALESTNGGGNTSMQLGKGKERMEIVEREQKVRDGSSSLPPSLQTRHGSVVRPDRAVRGANLVGKDAGTKLALKVEVKAVVVSNGSGMIVNQNVQNMSTRMGHSTGHKALRTLQVNGAGDHGDGSDSRKKADMTVKLSETQYGGVNRSEIKSVHQTLPKGAIQWVSSFASQAGMRGMYSVPVMTIKSESVLAPCFQAGGGAGISGDGHVASPTGNGCVVSKAVESEVHIENTKADDNEEKLRTSNEGSDGENGESDSDAQPTDNATPCKCKCAQEAAEKVGRKRTRGSELEMEHDRLLEQREALLKSVSTLEQKRQIQMTYSEKKKLCEEAACLDYGRTKSVAIMLAQGMNRPDLLNEAVIDIDIDWVDNSVLREIEYFLKNDTAETIAQSIRQLRSQIAQVERDLRAN